MYRTLVEGQTDLICRFMPDGTITFVNDAYCRYFEKRREDLVGHTLQSTMPDEDWHMFQDKMALISIDCFVVRSLHRVILPGGEVRWQQWTDRAMGDGGLRFPPPEMRIHHPGPLEIGPKADLLHSGLPGDGYGGPSVAAGGDVG